MKTTKLWATCALTAACFAFAAGHATANAEARLEIAIVKQFAMFDGIVKVGADHNAHQQPGHAAKP
jgi:hypothetical protein